MKLSTIAGGRVSLNVMTSVLRREEKRRWGDTEEKVT